VPGEKERGGEGDPGRDLAGEADRGREREGDAAGDRLEEAFVGTTPNPAPRHLLLASVLP